MRALGLAILGVSVALLLGGCGSSSGVQKVTGKIEFPGGEVPKGELAVVRFEPVATGGEGVRGASGDIQPDGTFQLTTLEPNDGAYPGEYKVALTVVKTYYGQEPLIDPKYSSVRTTPFSATVTAGGKNHFEFKVEGNPPK